MTEQDRATATDVGLHLLVLRCQVGDDRAFARLFEQFAPRTLRYLRGLVGEGAEDVQQDVWLSVYRSIAGLANPRAFRTWLFRTTRHRAVDHLRGRARQRELLADAALDRDHAETADDADLGLGDVDLDAALATLEAPHREVVLLRYHDDLSYADIAAVVGCSVGTVRSRLHYAKARLRALVRRP